MALNGTGIINPMPNGTSEFRVMADLDKSTWEYFFKGVFAGRKGPRQAMICTFFKKFHEACVLEGIVPVWDTDNEPRVNEILQRLNFHPVQMHKESKPKKKKGEPK